MKGILSKTENGWVVNYHFSVNNNDWEMLPLHPEFIEMMDNCFTSKFTRDVDFEIVTETYEDGKGCTYAKLIHHSVEANKMIDHIGEANEMVCIFEPTTNTSSATICKHCGQEKFLHNQVPDVKKKVEDDYIEELAKGEIGWYDKHDDDQVKAFIAGYNKAKETLYTEEQVREAMNCTVLSAKAKERVIQSLKQPK